MSHYNRQFRRMTNKLANALKITSNSKSGIVQMVPFAQTARKNLMNARLLLLAKFWPVTRVTWRKTFPFIKKTSGKRRIYIPFAARYLRFVKRSDCSQDKFDHCSCAQKWTHCLHTFKSSQRPFDNHITPFHFKGQLNNTPFKIALFDLSPLITNHHLKQAQNIRSSQKSLLLPPQAINTKPLFINNRETAV